MRIFSNEWKALEKRIAGLEREAQNHRDVLAKHPTDHEKENKDFHNILEGLKREVKKEITLTGYAGENIKPVSVDVSISGKPIGQNQY